MTDKVFRPKFLRNVLRTKEDRFAFWASVFAIVHMAVIVLRLTNVIHWSWFIVMLPELYMAFGLFIGAIFVMASVLNDLMEERKTHGK